MIERLIRFGAGDAGTTAEQRQYSLNGSLAS